MIPHLLVALLISVAFMTIPFIAGCEWPEHLLFLIPTIWYFIPTYIALYRKHPSKTGILVLNVVLGWAFFGWLGALIWACRSRTRLAHEATIRQTAGGSA